MGKWKPITGYKNYIISDEGQICNINTNKMLKAKRNKNDGYLRINLCKNGKTKTFLIHRLVATSFIPNPHMKRTVNHKNEIKNDNRVKNLEWMSDLENTNYGTGKERKAQKERKTVLQLNLDGEVVKRFNGIRVAARTLNLPLTSLARAVKSGERVYKNFMWKYE